MFEEKDGEDLRIELGLTDKRANELVDIVQNMMDQEAPPGGGCGRTSHVLLDIAGRKDLNDVEKAACVFLFCCKALNKEGKVRSGRSGGSGGKVRLPEISMPFMPGMEGLKTKEFIDIEGGASGMMIAPEGIGPEDAIYPIMALLMSMLRQMPKGEMQEFCRNASLSFAKIAMTGNVKL